MDKKYLLPESNYVAWDEKLVEERKKASIATMKFNTTGDFEILKEFFEDDLDNKKVIITPPIHSNYGGKHIKFGQKVFINANCTFQPAGGVEFGDNVFVGSDVKFYTTIHPVDPEERATGKASVRPIKIGSNVWIGGNVTILPGVEIGEGSTIGAGAVVTRSIPPRCVAVGNPCKVLRYLDIEKKE